MRPQAEGLPPCAGDEGPSTSGSLVAVLGASNVARGLPWLIEAARGGWSHGGPSAGRDLLVAGGHGRSYGLPTNVLGRTLPGLLDCGIWRQLEQMARDRPVSVVLTDIGNDLMYEVPAERLLTWVRTALARLPAGARVTITTPPLSSVAGLPAWRFRLLRTLFFPTRRVELSTLRDALGRVADGLREVASDPRVRLLEPPARWYGFDPIHTLRRSRDEAWRSMLDAGQGLPATGRGARSPGLPDRLYAWTARPADWAVFGLPCGAAQPSRRLVDGTRLWLY